MKSRLIHFIGHGLYIASRRHTLHISHDSLAALAQRKIDEKFCGVWIVRFRAQTDSIHLRQDRVERIDPIDRCTLLLHELDAIVESPPQRALTGGDEPGYETMPIAPRQILT